MKKMMLVLTLLITPLFFASCTSEYTQEEAAEKGAETLCDKIFSCEEGKVFRLGSTQDACNEKSIADNKVSECTGEYDGALTYDCIACMENLSCSDFFTQGKIYESCPECKESENKCAGK